MAVSANRHNPAPAVGTKGPHDDFFCHKYGVWYQVDDCVYRTTHATYSGCVNCFQGTLNARCASKGVAPPTFLAPVSGGSDTAAERGAVVMFPRRPRGEGR
jgi:hypothetical protein